MSESNMQERIEKTKSILKEELNTVRAGRANPTLLDKIVVDYYGTPTPLKNLSNISVPDPRSLLVTPFDPKSLVDIEHAINAANIGIVPNNQAVQQTGLANVELPHDGEADLVLVPGPFRLLRQQAGKQVQQVLQVALVEGADPHHVLESQGERTTDRKSVV